MRSGTLHADVPVAVTRSGAARRRRIHPVALLTLAAIAFRLFVFLGRGDYVAYDEGWYLLLGRNLLGGEGYTLSGLRHVTLSPLFPILAGALGTVVDTVWAGRIVAAVAGGLLVWPCWSIFSRIAGRRTAWLACVFVAVMPALAPFAAPYWIRWDLWVGSEPVLHVLLYAGIALALRGLTTERTLDYALAGICFALAYLARAEAILPFGILAALLGARAIWLRNLRAGANVAVLGLVFAVAAAPYWVYLHDAIGRWTITGRGVEMPARAAAGGGASNAANAIERMLWADDDRSYMYSLYSLDRDATGLASSYWGVPRTAPLHPVPPRDSAGAVTPRRASADTRAQPSPPPNRLALYARSLGIAVPWYLLPFIAFGALGRRRRWREEILTVGPLLLTSAAIAALVAADPRTQLFIAPLGAFYAARGVRRGAALADRKLRNSGLRRGFVGTAVAVVLVAVLAGTAIRWVYMGIAVGSPHHLVGTANRNVGSALRTIVPPDAAVMSWHPAIALFAQRDWRVLPHAPFEDVVRFANATGTEYITISQYYPAPAGIAELPREHLVLWIPPGSAAIRGGWHVDISDGAGPYAFGRLQPAVPQDNDRRAPR